MTEFRLSELPDQPSVPGPVSRHVCRPAHRRLRPARRAAHRARPRSATVALLDGARQRAQVVRPTRGSCRRRRARPDGAAGARALRPARCCGRPSPPRGRGAGRVARGGVHPRTDVEAIAPRRHDRCCRRANDGARTGAAHCGADAAASAAATAARPHAPAGALRCAPGRRTCSPSTTMPASSRRCRSPPRSRRPSWRKSSLIGACTRLASSPRCEGRDQPPPRRRRRDALERAADRPRACSSGGAAARVHRHDGSSRNRRDAGAAAVRLRASSTVSRWSCAPPGSPPGAGDPPGLDDETEHARSFRLPEPTADADILFRALHTHLENVADRRTHHGCAPGPRRPGRWRAAGFVETRPARSACFAETLARTVAVSAPVAGHAAARRHHRADAVELTPSVDVSRRGRGPYMRSSACRCVGFVRRLRRRSNSRSRAGLRVVRADARPVATARVPGAAPAIGGTPNRLEREEWSGSRRRRLYRVLRTPAAGSWRGI